MAGVALLLIVLGFLVAVGVHVVRDAFGQARALHAEGHGAPPGRHDLGNPGYPGGTLPTAGPAEASVWTALDDMQLMRILGRESPDR